MPAPPYSIGALIRDAESLIDHFALRDAVVIGDSLGGLVAQGLAVKRLDLVRGLVLSNTAARIGTPELWHARIAESQQTGLASDAEIALPRMLGPKYRSNPAETNLRRPLIQTPMVGWTGCAAAIAGADF